MLSSSLRLPQCPQPTPVYSPSSIDCAGVRESENSAIYSLPRSNVLYFTLICVPLLPFNSYVHLPVPKVQIQLWHLLCGRANWWPCCSPSTSMVAASIGNFQIVKNTSPPRRTGIKFADAIEKAQAGERAEAREYPSRK